MKKVNLAVILTVITEGTCIYNEGEHRHTFVGEVDEIPEDAKERFDYLTELVNEKDERVVSATFITETGFAGDLAIEEG